MPDFFFPKLVLDYPVPFCMLFLVMIDDLLLNFPPRIMLTCPIIKSKCFHLHGPI